MPARTKETAEQLLHGRITGEVIRAFYAVYDTLGYGFLETVYARALGVELGSAGVVARREVPIEVRYHGVEVGHFRCDYLVDDSVVVEIKATAQLSDADRNQLLNYLRASEKEVGLLLHFGPRASFRRIASTGGPMTR